MNIKERILEMNEFYASDQECELVEDIKDIKLTFLIQFQLFEPCRYVGEDDEWITFILLPPNEELGSQIMSLKKSEIVSFGICNEKNLLELEIKPKMESDGLYQ